MIGALDGSSTVMLGSTITWTRPLLGVLTKETPHPRPRILCNLDLEQFSSSTTPPKPGVSPRGTLDAAGVLSRVRPLVSSLLGSLNSNIALSSSLACGTLAHPHQLTNLALCPRPRRLSPTDSTAGHRDKPFTPSLPLFFQVRVCFYSQGIESSSRSPDRAVRLVSSGRFPSGT